MILEESCAFVDIDISLSEEVIQLTDINELIKCNTERDDSFFDMPQTQSTTEKKTLDTNEFTFNPKMISNVSSSDQESADADDLVPETRSPSSSNTVGQLFAFEDQVKSEMQSNIARSVIRKARRNFINDFHSFCGSNYYALSQPEYSEKVVEFTNERFSEIKGDQQTTLLLVHSLLNF